MNADYSPPEAWEVAEMVNMLGGQVTVARLLGKTQPTISMWCNGKTRIDYANWKVLCDINKARAVV